MICIFYLKQKERIKIMSQQQKHILCQNFIEQVLTNNHINQNKPKQKDSQGYASYMVDEKQPSTPSKTQNITLPSATQKNSSTKTSQPSSPVIQQIKRGHWSQDENRKYHWFLQMHSKHFISKQKRRFDKIFKIMATYVRSRQAEQCRSHHQKMQKKYHTFTNILLVLRRLTYGDQSVHSLEKDLVKNGMVIIDPLLTQKQLRQLSIKKNKGHSNNSQNKKNKTKAKKLNVKKHIEQEIIKNQFQQKNKSVTRSSANNNYNLKQTNIKHLILQKQQVLDEREKQINEIKHKIQQMNEQVHEILEKQKQEYMKKQTKQSQLDLQKYSEYQNQLSKFKQRQQSMFKFRDFLGQDYQHRLSIHDFLA